MMLILRMALWMGISGDPPRALVIQKSMAHHKRNAHTIIDQESGTHICILAGIYINTNNGDVYPTTFTTCD